METFYLLDTHLPINTNQLCLIQQWIEAKMKQIQPILSNRIRLSLLSQGCTRINQCIYRQGLLHSSDSSCVLLC